MLVNNNNEIHHVNLIEKLLATLLAKCSNFIPETGIWLTTQRPEWNDANNALVGNGVSMVTLYYMRRFLSFFKDTLEKSEKEKVLISSELHEFFSETINALKTYEHLLSSTISDVDRKKIIDALGNAASKYRMGIYNTGFSSEKTNITNENLLDFSNIMLSYLDHSISCLLYTSPSPRDQRGSRMPSSA